MAAVTIDAAVSSSGAVLYPNPLPPLNAPVDIDPIEQPNTLAPVDLTAIAAGDIGAPSLLPDVDQPAIDTPVIIADVDQPALALPSVFTPIAVDAEAPPFALKHARILYDNLLAGSTVSADSGTNPAYTLIPNTAQRWSFSGGGAVTFVLPANVDIDTVTLGAHNMGSSDYTVGVDYDTTTGGSFAAFATGVSPTKDTAIMFHRSTTVSVRRLRVTCSGTGADMFVGSIYAGIALQMQRPFFAGHTPINLSAVTDYYSSRTESGNFIGREIRAREFSTSASWDNISDTWYRAYFQTFVESAKTLPFYFAWNLDQYPLDVGYCITSADIAPSYSGTRDLFSVSFDLVGLA